MKSTDTEVTAEVISDTSLLENKMTWEERRVAESLSVSCGGRMKEPEQCITGAHRWLRKVHRGGVVEWQCKELQAKGGNDCKY